MNTGKTVLFSFLFLILSITLSAQERNIYQNSTFSTEERVKDLLSRMTTREKIAQVRHLMSWDVLNGQKLDYEKLEEVTKGGVAWGFVDGFPLTGTSSQFVMNEIQKFMVEKTRLGIPIFTVGESLHGAAHEGATIFPQNIALGSTFNPELAYLRSKMTTRDLHAQGLRQVLAPCIDVVRDLRWGRVEEGYGEDPFLSGTLAIAEVNGYLEHGIQPMLKHFGPHGNPLGGLNLASVECGSRDLLDVYLKPFEMVVKNTKVMAIMSSYNSWNRIPNSASPYLLTEVLREDWGFKGYVYSDWGAIGMLQSFHHVAQSKEESAIQSLTAGLDAEASSDAFPTLIEAIDRGTLDEAYLDSAVTRVLRAKFEAGLFDDPYGLAYQKYPMHTKESVDVSRRIADESTVLLKNEGNLLPLKIENLKSIAVLGPNADQVQFGDYTWSRSNKDGVTPLEGLQKLVGNRLVLNYAKGADMMSKDVSLISEAVAMAKKSDLSIIFCGSSSASLARDYSNTNCGEGFDLHDLQLTGSQPELIRAVHAVGKPVILVLVSGKPFTIEWEKEHLPAILVQWYAGEEAGNSIAAILFGGVNPSGKLSYSFPRSVGHLPAYYNHLPSDKGFYKQPGSYASPGRDYVFSSPTNLWNFGHGLSYTSFQFDQLALNKKNFAEDEKIDVALNVTNTGSKEGKEVVQIYIRDIVSSVVTPVKQLKAFQKVALKAGESKRVKLTIPVSELYIRDSKNEKKVESGEFELQIGNSSDHILLRDTISVGHLLEEGVSTNKITARVPKETIEVKGTIRDVQATLIPDAMVYSLLLKKVVGKTSEKGVYRVNVPMNDVLSFEKVGYETLQVEVKNRKDLNVSLNYKN